MLLSGYTKTILRPECNPNFRSVHCIARLNEDVGKALPYLNSVLGATHYLQDPPELVLHHQGKIIKVGAREIAINALRDELEADLILGWLKDEINRAWENRDKLTPCFTGKIKPQLIAILKLLPRTNCGKCGQPTCMAFAALVMEGGRDAGHCTELTQDNRERLAEYLAGFEFE